MRCVISILAIFGSLSPAYAQDQRVWSGVFTDGGKNSVYKLTIYDEPEHDLEAYLLTQSTGIETCYVSFTEVVDTGVQIVLMGLPDDDRRSFGTNVDFPACVDVGWVAGEKMTLMLDPIAGVMQVVVDGITVETVTVAPH